MRERHTLILLINQICGDIKWQNLHEEGEPRHSYYFDDTFDIVNISLKHLNNLMPRTAM